MLFTLSDEEIFFAEFCSELGSFYKLHLFSEGEGLSFMEWDSNSRFQLQSSKGNRRLDCTVGSTGYFIIRVLIQR